MKYQPKKQSKANVEPKNSTEITNLKHNSRTSSNCYYSWVLLLIDKTSFTPYFISIWYFVEIFY